jgi:phenylpropionate dioxygenase-like ring-hydroxylating dioxygenase large terminal subunit
VTTIAAPLARTYDAYHSVRGLAEDADLTRVGRGTLMGELFRRYWQPIAYTSDLTDLPLKLRILGEDLVLFRTGTGEYGLVEQRCSHRGASLEYGVISDRGVRCAYHGFHYAPDGTILETGAGAPLANGGKICHGAYPVFVFHELIFAYMGPPEKIPPFPMLDLFDFPHITVLPVPERANVVACNWLQMHENAMDPAHTAYLHAIVSGTQRGFSDQMGIVPVMQWMQSEHGMYYIASRRVDERVWVRVVDVFLPAFGLIPPPDQHGDRENTSQAARMVVWVVPLDDTHNKRFYLMFSDERNPITAQQRAYPNPPRPYEEAQRSPGDDEVMLGQGPITVHATENLTPTDYGVIALRQLYRDNALAVREGRDPIGVIRDPNAVMRSRAQNTVLRVPPAATPEADIALLKEVGRKVAEGNYLREFPPV